MLLAPLLPMRVLGSSLPGPGGTHAHALQGQLLTIDDFQVWEKYDKSWVLGNFDILDGAANRESGWLVEG